MPKKPPRKINQLTTPYQKLTLIFAILAVIIIGGILYFALSQATITITPNWRLQNVGFALQVVDKTKVSEEPTDKLAGILLTTTLDATQTFEAKKITEQQNKVIGTVTITNNSSKDQKLVATTRLLTADGKLYRLSKFVDVAAGKKVTAEAVADQPGDEYISGPVKMTIPGLWQPLQDKIYAETDGFNKAVLVKHVIDRDIVNQAKTELQNKLLEQAKNQLSQNLPQGYSINLNTLSAEQVKFSTDAKIGKAQENFIASLTVNVKALAIDENKLITLASATLPQTYQANNALTKIDPSSFTYQTIMLDANSENLLAQIKGTYNVAVANINIDKNQLKGQSKKQAENYLKSQSDVLEVNIAIPFWTWTLPELTDKINIVINK